LSIVGMLPATDSDVSFEAMGKGFNWIIEIWEVFILAVHLLHSITLYTASSQRLENANSDEEDDGNLEGTLDDLPLGIFEVPVFSSHGNIEEMSESQPGIFTFYL
jgi:hypothetical protein